MEIANVTLGGLGLIAQRDLLFMATLPLTEQLYVMMDGTEFHVTRKFAQIFATAEDFVSMVIVSAIKAGPDQHVI
jgi:hypothetical protein